MSDREPFGPRSLSFVRSLRVNGARGYWSLPQVGFVQYERSMPADSRLSERSSQTHAAGHSASVEQPSTQTLKSS